MEHSRLHSGWEEIDATTSGITSLGTGGTAKLSYRRQGTTAHLRLVITFGTGGGGGAGTWSVALPSGWAGSAGTNDYQMGHALFNDTTTAAVDGRCYVQPGGTSLLLQALNVAGTYPTWTNVTGTVPFTWTSGDFLSCNITLELAS
jgi:hypothetical protein